MKRDLAALTGQTFDLLIIGGGIAGAWAAWDAVLRGLSVALVEQGDFGAATSANSLKIIHGGLRYLQQANLRRMRESIRERTALARVAPQLVRPLPCLVPTYGHGTRGRGALRIALSLSDLIGLDRNRGVPPEARLPAGRTLSREECLRLFPHFDPRGLTGGALWYDAQALDTERLTQAVLHSAAERGAALANYLRAERILVRGGFVEGAQVRDRVTGESFPVRARTLLAAVGPWTAELLATTGQPPHAPHIPLTLAINLVTPRRVSPVAVALRVQGGAVADAIGGGDRYLFLTPWQNGTLIGTSYREHHGSAHEVRVGRADLQALLDACNVASPSLQLTLEDITAYHRGLLPLRPRARGDTAFALADRDRILDPGESGGPAGLVAMIGVKYTTARLLAEHGVDRIFAALGRQAPRSRSAEIPLTAATAAVGPELAEEELRHAVLHAVREEMAQTLADVVLRRTALGAQRRPAQPVLEAAARVMGEELGWSEARRRAEIAGVLRTYEPLAPHAESVPIQPVQESLLP